MQIVSWTFFQEFLRAPRTVASIIPSSPFVERRVVSSANADQAQLVVEFGAGTGGITRALLRSMAPGAQLLVIERTGKFVGGLEKIGDSRLTVAHDCASSIIRQLQERELGSADAVVSGIPFSTLPKPLCTEIMAGIHAALRPGGRFVAYQFTDRVADYARPLLGPPRVQHELLNVPPLRVFTWSKDAAMAAKGHPAAD
jgi:phosphatidylethanolamine/phosphatidyl-N-methylethanolamine N-methyltransferase